MRGGGCVGLSFEKSHPGLFIEKGVLRGSMVVARGDDNGAGVEEAVTCRVEASLLSASVSEPRALTWLAAFWPKTLDSWGKAVRPHWWILASVFPTSTLATRFFTSRETSQAT